MPMKRYLLIILMSASACAGAQTKKDYVDMMIRLQALYNHMPAAPTASVFLNDNRAGIWPPCMNTDTLEKYGNIVSFRYLPQPAGHKGGLFKLKFTKAQPAALFFRLNLPDSAGRIDSVSFNPHSIYINGLMNEYK